MLRPIQESLSQGAGASTEGNSRRDLVISGLAMLGLALILGVVGVWLIRGGLSNGWEGLYERRSFSGRRTSTAGFLWLMFVSGGLLSGLSLVLVIVGLRSVGVGALRRPGVEDAADDDADVYVPRRSAPDDAGARGGEDREGAARAARRRTRTGR